MVLEKLRDPMTRALDPLVNLLIDIDPNVFSVLSLVFAVLAGVLYAVSDLWTPGAGAGSYPWLLLVALFFVILNSIADSLDGRIARLSGKVTSLGDFLDHSFDRFSDIAILAGISLSGYCDTTFGLLTLISVLLSSYMGTQAQAVGVGRDYSGIMGRADRMVLLLLTTAIQFLVQAGWGRMGWDPGGWIGHEVSLLEVLMGIMLIGGLFTTLQRGAQTFISLKRKDTEMASGGGGRTGPRHAMPDRLGPSGRGASKPAQTDRERRFHGKSR